MNPQEHPQPLDPANGRLGANDPLVAASRLIQKRATKAGLYAATSADTQSHLLAAMNLSIKDSTVRVVCYGANLLLGLFSLLYVAKIAGPSEVGLYTGALVIAQPFSDFFSTGITRAGFAGQNEDYPALVKANTLFAGLLSFGLLIWGTLSDSPEIMQLLAFTVLLSSVDGYQSGVLLRQLKFKRSAIAGTVSVAMGLVATILSMEWETPSVAMAIGMLAMCVSKVALNGVGVVPPRQPGDTGLSFSRLRSCWIFSASKMLGNITRNVPVWSAIACCDANQVGILSRAQRIAEVPSNVFGAGKGGMIAPIMVGIHRSGGDVHQYYQSNLRAAAIHSLPLFLLVSVGVVFIEIFYLGSEWEGLALVGILMGLSSSFRNLNKVTDDYSRQLGMEYFSPLLNLVAIPLTYFAYTYALSRTGSLFSVSACFVAFAALFWIVRFVYVMRKRGEDEDNWCVSTVRQLGAVSILSVTAQFVVAAILVNYLLSR